MGRRDASPQRLPDELIEHGRTIPVARVAAMHEGKRRARAQRDGRGPVGRAYPPAGLTMVTLVRPLTVSTGNRTGFTSSSMDSA